MSLEVTRRKRSGSKDGAKAHPQAARALDDRDGGKVFFDSSYGDNDGDDDDGVKSPSWLHVNLTSKLPFQYKGDVFSQRGCYAEASLYMSRLPPTRNALPSRLRRGGGGNNYKLQVKLAPMPQSKQQSLPYRQDVQVEPLGCVSSSTAASTASANGSGTSGSNGNSNSNNATKSGRKQQYAIAVADMAANPALHAKLLGDSAILASIVSFGRTKDVVTMGACVATLGHLSRQPEGRVAILNHSALALLIGLSFTLNVASHTHSHADEKSPPSGNALILRDCLAALANLTIEDGLEAGFIKEKGLESLLRHRKNSAFVENACAMAIFNLSCPAYSYPRVDDVVAAVIEIAARDRAHGTCETDGEQQTMVQLSRALYNLSSVKTNHVKLAEPDAILALQLMISQHQSREVRRNALAALWHLAAGSSACRRSIVRCCTGGGGGCHCIAIIVDQLRRQDLVISAEIDDLLCALSILDCLARGEVARELMARSNVLDALAALAISLLSLSAEANQAGGLHAVTLRLMGLVLSLPTNISATTERVFQLLVSFRYHDAEGPTAEVSTAKILSRSVLFALASILSWSGDADTRTPTQKKESSSKAGSSPGRVAAGSAAMVSVIAGGGSAATSPSLSFPPPRLPFPPGSSVSVDDILDQPGRLEGVYRHVSIFVFAPTSSESYLQMALLYNMSFRYSKVDVAVLAFPRLLAIAEQNRTTVTSVLYQRQRETLALVGGTVFNLCQEYEVHPMLATPDGLRLLWILLETGQGINGSSADGDDESETQRLCLDTVCLLFDGRTVPRAELVRVVSDLFPTVRDICSTNRSRRDAQVRAACGACLSRFATVNECRLFMIQHGVLAALSTLADTTDDDTNSSGECLRHCATTYALLASAASDANPAISTALIDGGIVKALTLLADAPEEAVRRLCATVLCNLSTSEHVVTAMVKCGALRALLVISCVKSNDPETRRICMKSVLNLLRRQENVPQMCQEGLLWAFGLFFAAGGSEGSGSSMKTESRVLHAMAGTAATATRDHEMLADACALSYYTQTRSGLVKKPAMVASILKMLQASLPPSPSALSTATVRKIVSGVLNLLNETDFSDRSGGAAPMLLRLGVVPAVLQLLDGLREPDDLSSNDADDKDEMRVLVAQILAIVFQTCAAGAETEFMRPEMVRSIVDLLKATSRSSQRRQWCERCGKSCALLLYLMSQLDRTRAALVAPVATTDNADSGADELWCVLPRAFRAVDADCSTGHANGTASTRLLLFRCIYNLTCDASMVDEALAARVLPALGVLLPSQSAAQLVQSAAIVAGVLRNLSTRAGCLETLTSDTATTLLREAFASGADAARRDVALCTCNLFLGNINSHELLNRASLLPHVLWMCSNSTNPPPVSRMSSGSTTDTDTSASANGASSPSIEVSMAAIASAVLRKLATAPGNVTELLDNGVFHTPRQPYAQLHQQYVRESQLHGELLLVGTAPRSTGTACAHRSHHSHARGS